MVHVLLTFGFSWSFWIPAALLFQGTLEGVRVWQQPLMILLQTLGAAGPSLMAFLLVWHHAGAGGVRDFVNCGLRRPAGNWVMGGLLIPALAVVALLLHRLLDPGFQLPEGSPLGTMVRDIGWWGVVLTFPLVLLSQVFTSPVLEEFGWRGFVLPQLQTRLSALTSNLLLGLIWGLWHLPLVLAYGDAFGPYLLLIVANALLMGHLFNRSGGSMLVALLVHASMNVAMNLLSVQRNDPILIVLCWLCVGVVVWRHGAQNLAPRPAVKWEVHGKDLP